MQGNADSYYDYLFLDYALAYVHTYEWIDKQTDRTQTADRLIDKVICR